jgi:hypothetical protein
MTIAEPLALTNEIVVLRRSTYDALMAAVEEARAARALAELRAREAEYVPIELADRIFAGEHPVWVWREHRGGTLGVLAKSAILAPSYLSEIEAGKKLGSTRALAAIARPCASQSRTSAARTLKRGPASPSGVPTLVSPKCLNSKHDPGGRSRRFKTCGYSQSFVT